MRKLVMALCLFVAAAPAAAVEIPFRDGSVIEAVSYTLTGSYVMLEMPGGAKVAYDVADIDVDALRQVEEAAAAAEAGVEESATGLGGTGALTLPDAEQESGGLTITDQHVKHVRGSGIAGPEDDETTEPTDPNAVPEGFEQGGSVLLNNVSVTPLDGGQFQVTGEVVNRTSESVMEVSANLQAPVPDGDPWTASVPVSALLAPDEKANFSHLFSAPSGAGDDWSPQIQVNVIWQRGETRLEPNYNRMPPHPSSLPVDVGGVQGADVRDEDNEW